MKNDIIFYILRWLTGFTEIIDGLFKVITLGSYSPNLSFKLVAYSTKRSIKKRLKMR